MGCWGQWVGADTCAVSGRGVSGSEGHIRFRAVVCRAPRGTSGFGPWCVGLRGVHPVLGRGVSGNVRIVARHSPKRGSVGSGPGTGLGRRAALGAGTSGTHVLQSLMSENREKPALNSAKHKRAEGVGCWGVAGQRILQPRGLGAAAQGAHPVLGRGVSGSEGYIRFWAVVCQETCELWHSTAQNGDPWGPGRVPVWGAGLGLGTARGAEALGQAERMFCRV